LLVGKEGSRLQNPGCGSAIYTNRTLEGPLYGEAGDKVNEEDEREEGVSEVPRVLTYYFKDTRSLYERWNKWK
jgi:hypothetical protein